MAIVIAILVGIAATMTNISILRRLVILLMIMIKVITRVIVTTRPEVIAMNMVTVVIVAMAMLVAVQYCYQHDTPSSPQLLLITIMISTLRGHQHPSSRSINQPPAS